MNRLYIVLAAWLLCFVNPVQSQVCNNALPFKQGATFEMTSYSDKGKLQSISKSKIMEVKNVGNTVESTIAVELVDDKQKTVGNSSYQVRCENDVFYMTLKNMLDPAMMKAYEGMEVEVKADDLDRPATAQTGQKLKDGQVVMTVSGPFTMTNTINITNRVIAGKETITTPAGTFDCIKLTSDIGTKVMSMQVNSKSEEWYAPEVGTVQTRSYNDKGKLTGYSQLTAITK